MPKILSDLLAAIGETNSPSVDTGGPAVLGDLLSAIGETPAEAKATLPDLTPNPFEREMPDIPKPQTMAYPEDTLTEIQVPRWNTRDEISNFVGVATDALRAGVSNMVSGLLTPSQRDTGMLEWLETADDAQVRDAVMKGQIDNKYRRYVMLPQAERQAAVQRALSGQAEYESRIKALTDVIAPQPGHEPTSTLGQMGYKALEMAPGVAANLAKWAILGGPATVALNTLSGNEAAKEQVYAAQRAQGKPVPEALDQTRSPAWNLADVLARGGTEAATLYALGIPPTIGGAWNPVMQGLGHVGAAAGASGAGGALENIIGNLWSGQNVDAGGALKAAGQSAAATGLMGLFNMALKGRQLWDQTKAHYAVKEKVGQYNDAVSRRGFTKITPEGDNGFSMSDSQQQIENAILGGNIDPMAARDMLVEAGLGTEDEVTAGILNLLMKNGRWSRVQGRGLGGDTQPQTSHAPMLPAAASQTPVQNAPSAPAPVQPQTTLEQVLSLGGKAPEPLSAGTPQKQRPIPIGGALRGEEPIAMTGGAEAQAQQMASAQPANDVNEEPEISGVVNKKWGLPKGYEVEGAKNPRNLKGAKQHQFVLRNGSRDWGYVTEELAAGRPEVPVGPIRVTVGDRGFGLKHVHSKHLKDALAASSSVEEYISHIIDDGDEIIPLEVDDRGRATEFLVAKSGEESKQDAVIIAWENEGYYTLKSAYTYKEQYLDKQKSLSSESSSPTSAPAPTPIPSATAQAKPEFLGDRQRYGDSDSATASPKRPKRGSTPSGPVSAVPLNEDTIPQPAAEVKETDGTSSSQEPEKADKSPSMTLAEKVAARIADNGAAMETKDLTDMADEAFGGTMGAGKYSIKDAYDAMEMGVNKAIQAQKINPAKAGTPEKAARDLQKLYHFMGGLPTQTNRTEEQVEFQQFSTPPTIAYIANWLSGVDKGDVVLEPSAGVGGLAVFAKNAGAEVVLNELSDRRADLLEQMGLGKVYKKNAEHIHDILPDDVKPTKVIMNPPFSSTAGRLKGKKNDTHNAEAHVKQALERLEPGGRLVAILGKGMADSAPAFRDFWDGIKKKYNVRANVLLDGKEYKKYGTTFGNAIVVIDKTGPTPEGGTVTGSFSTIGEMLEPLMGVRNSAPKAEGTNRTRANENNARVNEDNTRANAEAEPAKTETPKAEEKKTEPKPKPAEPREEVQPAQEPEEKAEPAPKPAVTVEKKSETERREERKAKAEAEIREARGGENNDQNVFDSYTPSRIKIRGAKPHPADLVESAAMASVPMPETDYSPNLPKEVITEGRLSEAQLEAVVYAGTAFEQKNADGTRRGFFIGDGTGVGKGREISGVITDQMAQGHGKGKAVWISDNAGLLKDAQRDWEGLGNDPEDIFAQGKIKDKEAITRDKGILFTAYSTLRGTGAQNPRLDQLKEWLGEGFDGVIALDEVHNANNAQEGKPDRGSGGFGVKKPSKQALAIQDLVKAFPKARVLYVSATGATEVRNLAMLDRLGLWGEGTPFSDVDDFVSSIAKGGTAAMEVAARDMKALGLYMARSVSKRAGPNGGTENATFERMTHNLTEAQLVTYDRIADAWQVAEQNIDKCLEMLSGTSDRSMTRAARGQVMSAFRGAQQRCFNQIITAMQTPAMIARIKEDLKAGRSVVIQLTNTDESATENAISGLKKNETLEDLDVTPRDMLIKFVRKSFPVNKMEQYTDEKGNTRIREVKDSDGKPVISKEAVRMRDDLITDLETIKFPESPLDMILNAFGTENVAEVTGRTRRVVRGKDGKRIIERRPKTANKAEINAFNNGDKHILVFSEAGGTGESYHASRDYKNQQKRVHYLLQAGWRADKAVQGLGRTLRSNQAHMPHYVLVETDIPGQARFISTIARRLGQLGALSTGERKTTTSGLFSERDNLEGEQARLGYIHMFENLLAGRYEDMDAADIVRQLGYDPQQFTGDAGKLPPLQQFLNRILGLHVADQKKLMAHFNQEIDDQIAWAIQNGTLDTGMETLKADKVRVVEEKVVNKDSGTRYVKLETQMKQKPVSMNNVMTLGFDEFYRTRDGGIVAARKTARTETDLKTGEIKEVWELRTPDPTYRQTTKALGNEDYYTRLDLPEAQKLWKETADALPEYRTNTQHLITGALLPVWKKLEGNPKIQRVITDDGQSYLGRLLSPTELAGTLGRLGMDYEGEKISPEEMFQKLAKQGTVAKMANGWTLKASRVNGEVRVELEGADFGEVSLLERAGAIKERVGGFGAWRVFIPKGNTELMKKVLGKAAVISIGKGNVLDETAQMINADIPDDVSYRLNFLAPGFNIELNPFIKKAEAAPREMPEPAAQQTDGRPGFSNPETEARFQEGRKGVKKETLFGKIKHAARALYDGFKSDFPELTGRAESGADLHRGHELLRKVVREMGAQVQKASQTLEASLKDLTPEEFEMFTRARILMDLSYQKSTMPDSLLPYGWTDEAFKRDYDTITKWVKEKEPRVREAIDREEEIIRAMDEEMSDIFGRLGWDISEKFKNPHYFHHVVLEYANAAATGKSLRNNAKAPDNRGYLKRRRGSDKDISADYIASQGEVRAQMFADIVVGKMLNEMKAEYDIMPHLKRTAFLMNEQTVKAQLAEIVGFGAESLFKKEFNQKQAMALSRLFQLAADGYLPEGNFGDVVSAMEDAGCVENMPEGARGRFHKYLGWLANLEEDTAGRGAARGYFKGVAEKKAKMKEALKDEYLTWDDLIPDGYTVWDPFNNRLVFSVSAVPENIVKMMEERLAKDPDKPLPVTLNDLVKMRVLGGHRQMWVIPTEVAAALDAMGQRRANGMLDTLARKGVTLWKKLILMGPWRVGQYNLRNGTGDLDSVVAGAPGVLLRVGTAWKDLWGLYWRGKAATGELAEFQRRGGALTAESLQELYDWNSARSFKHLSPKEKTRLSKILARIGGGYSELAQRFTNWRESILRYAAYLYFLDDMLEHDGVPTRWGASLPEEVMALKDVRDRAYKMATELLGDYSQVSRNGQYLRQGWMPFYSWKEVNFRRTLRLLRNGMAGRDWLSADIRLALARMGGGNGGGTKGPGIAGVAGMGDDGGMRLFTTVAGVALRLPTLALRVAMSLATNFWFWAMTALWNWDILCPWNWFGEPGKDEQAFSPDKRETPHIIFGSNPATGDVYYLDRLGSMPDFLEDFGLEQFPSDIRMIWNGQQTWGDFLKKMAEKVTSTPVNMLTPFITVPANIMTKRITYPNIWESRPMRDWISYVASSLGLSMPVAEIRKWLQDKPGADFWSMEHARSFFMKTTNPRMEAYYYILDRRHKFQEDVLGRTFDGMASSNRTEALGNIKSAMRYGDTKRAQRWIDRYAELEGASKQGLKASLASMHPLAGLSKKDMGRFEEWLGEDKKYLSMAEAHFREMERSISQK